MTIEHLQFTQKRELFSLGQYIALSVAHGGNGFPVLAEPVYKYIATMNSVFPPRAFLTVT